MAKKTTKKTAKKSPVKKTVKKAPTKKVAVKKAAPKKTVAPAKRAAPKKKAEPKAVAKPVSKPTEPKKKKCKAMPIIGLIVNILIVPGLGTLIGGGKQKVRNGLIQLILSIVAYALILTMVGAVIGAPLLLAMWIWAIVDMAKVLGGR